MKKQNAVLSNPVHFEATESKSLWDTTFLSLDTSIMTVIAWLDSGVIGWVITCPLQRVSFDNLSLTMSFIVFWNVMSCRLLKTDILSLRYGFMKSFVLGCDVV